MNKEVRKLMKNHNLPKSTMTIYGLEIERIAEDYAKHQVKSLSIPVVSDSTFTNDELKAIKIDTVHVLDHVDLNEVDMDKRNSVLNKVNSILGDEY